jgi:hypothetical protein
MLKQTYFMRVSDNDNAVELWQLWIQDNGFDPQIPQMLNCHTTILSIVLKNRLEAKHLKRNNTIVYEAAIHCIISFCSIAGKM